MRHKLSLICPFVAAPMCNEPEPKHPGALLHMPINIPGKFHHCICNTFRDMGDTNFRWNFPLWPRCAMNRNENTQVRNFICRLTFLENFITVSAILSEIWATQFFVEISLCDPDVQWTGTKTPRCATSHDYKYSWKVSSPYLQYFQRYARHKLFITHAHTHAHTDGQEQI